jgi:FKBP-type peptidyl-prolyl cis-trans isomerase FklB
MKTHTLLLFTALLGFGTLQAQKETTMDSVSYSLGVLVAQNLKTQGFDELEAGSLAKGLADGLSGENMALDANQANAVVQNYLMEKRQEASKGVIEEGRKFLEENGKREGVTTTASGLQYEVMKSGDGPTPLATDKVTVHYHGTLINGKVFDSSVNRGTPASFPVNGVIQGWVEALQLMKVGDKWKLFIPSELAYGERGAGNDIGPFATLIFEVELLSIDKK